MQYKYKVCKGQKVLALSTTLREAEQEARRVGGVVLAIGSKRKNPLDFDSKATYVPQRSMIGAEAFYTFAQDAGVPSENQTMGKMIKLYNRLRERNYLYEGVNGYWEVAKNIPVKVFVEAAQDAGLLLGGTTDPNLWVRAGEVVTYHSLYHALAHGGFLNDLYEHYHKASAKKIGNLQHITDRLSDRLLDTGDCRLENHTLTAKSDITKDRLKTLAKQVLEEKLAEIGPKRIKKERIRVATAKEAEARVKADKQAHEGTDKFPLRPVGVDGPFDTPQGMGVEPPRSAYLVTLLAPKCFAPVSYFLRERSVFGYSPDLTLYYTNGYFDDSEESADGLPRVHMDGLQDYDQDRGKGIGPLAYMVMPFAALRKYHVSEVFSPEESGGPRDYIYRTKDADRAWANLIEAGIADQETEGGMEYLSETVDLRGVLEAGSSPLYDWDTVDRIDPRYVEVEGEKEGEAITIDKIHLRTVLLDQRTLHVSDNLWTRITDNGLVNAKDAISPAAEAWAEIDMLHCTPDEVEAMVEFCSQHGGSEQGDYLRELAGVIGTNPTYRKGTLDNLLAKFGLEVKTQNPRRRNPEAQSWIRRNKQAFWDSPEASKQAEEKTKNPKASKKLSANQQKKYLGTLTGAAREARAKEILHRREHRSNKPFKTDKGQQTKHSSHARKFAQKYGRAPRDVADAAQLAKVSERILNEVYARGMAAWQTGHRPGASQHAWAMARVESFLTGGPTSKTADADLARKLR